MLIVVQHAISNPDEFWATARKAMPVLPSDLRLRQVLPAVGGDQAACVWEAPSVARLRDFLEASVGAVSRNTYWEVNAKDAVGLLES